MTRNLLFLSLCVIDSLWGQSGSAAADAAAQTAKKVLTDASTAGTPLPVTIDVSDNINVEAVMLPQSVVRRVFGREVSDTYAVIEVNISNRSNDAALILHSLFIDMSGWSLAGPLVSAPPRKGKQYQAKASTNEVASVEYRIVRGQMQDAQPWSNRNVAYRTIEVLGSIGTAFAFPFSKDIVAGIGAWNGAVVPGFDRFWPDGMVAQINRVSDYGFRNNKIIPQQSADIVIAFFPVERFLSPSLQKVFLKSPALFFNPFLLALDPASGQLVEKVLERALGLTSQQQVDVKLAELVQLMASLDQQKIARDKAELGDAREAWEASGKTLAKNQAAIDQEARDLTKAAAGKDTRRVKNLTAALESDRQILEASETKHKADYTALTAVERALETDYAPLKRNALYGLFNAMSLNNVHITLSGVMTVDELTIPATIESTCFETAGAEMWAIAGDKSCSISGRFLGNGTPKIPDAGTLGISAIAVNKEASTSELLKFTFKLKEPLKSPVEFDLLVVKEGKNGKNTDSMPYRVKSSFTLPGPVITAVAKTENAKEFAVTGTGFYSGPGNEFSVSLRKPDKTELAVASPAPDKSTAFTLDISKLTDIAPGCYRVAVKVGTAVAVSDDQNQVRVAADPVIASVKKSADGKSLEVTGKQLTGTQDCGGSDVAYEVLDENAKPLTVSKVTNKGTAASLEMAAPDLEKSKSVRLKGAAGAGVSIN